MKRFILLPVLLCILTALAAGQAVIQAQASGPIVDILGKPDSSSPPDVHAYVSVVDPSTGRVIDGLGDANFSVLVSEEDAGATVSPATTGVAVVMVIDRGGIGQSGTRRGWVVDLADSLLDMLNVDGSEGADMVSLIGIRGREEHDLTPLVPFTDWNPNDVRNEFDGLRNEAVQEVTPLYDGIDKAIEWFTANPDPQLQDKLTRRRPIIVVFSDGIDNRFSNEAHETIIIDECRKNGILLYAVRIGGGSTDVDNLQALATQTKGLYVDHGAEDDTKASSLFQDIVTQRQSYRVSFPLYRPQGDYDVRIRVVDTPIGAGSDETTVSSRLQESGLALTSPPDGLEVNVAYSGTFESGIFLPQTVDLNVQITSVDGAERFPQEVSYFANGNLIGKSSAQPAFDFTWDVTNIVTPTESTQKQGFTIMARAKDAFLGTEMASQSASVTVIWGKRPLAPTPTPLPPIEIVKTEARSNWWIIIILLGLLAGLLVLLLLFRRLQTRLESTPIGRAATGILRKTKLLGPLPPAPGKLVIVQGANMGREFRLAATLVKIGRDPQFCDFAVYDEFVSNPHFSVQQEASQFFITDEGSSNGTRVNGVPLQPQRRMPLQPDAVIEIGQTRLQFKRLGGPTQPLGAQPGPGATPGGPPASSPPPGQAQWPGHQPPQPPPPQGQAGQDQGPAQQGSERRGGPTRVVR